MSCELKHIKKLLKHAKERKFSFPDGFKELSIKYIAERYNGIGAEWMPPRLRKLLTQWLSMLEAEAMIHDIEYLSEDKSYWRFTVANARLAYNSWKDRDFLHGSLAAIVCQLFGWPAWKEGRETMSYYYHFKEGNGTP